MTKIATSKLASGKFSKIRGRVKSTGSTNVKLDDMIELTIADRFNNIAYVSGLRYYFAAGKLEMDIEFGLPAKKHAEQFDDIVEKPANGFLPAVNGLQIGLVEKLESDPSGEGRVLVKIPLVSETDEAVWARVSTLDAGKARGSFFMPEIGDEVLLGFLNDDPCQAVILGMLNGSKNTAPLTAANANPQKGFITREKMKLLFDDKDKVITIETPSGNKIAISEKDKGITITDQNNNKCELNNNGITVESASKLTIKATTDIKIEGVNIELKASANLKTEGSAGASLKSSGMTEVKGSMVNIN
jgi:Rhs element Vgr protein